MPVIWAQGMSGWLAWKLRRETACGFGYDLDPALDAMTKEPIGAKIVEGLRSHGVLDAFNRLAKLREGGLNKPLRRKDSLDAEARS